MIESLGKGPRPNATPSTLHYRNSKIAPSAVWHQPVGIWSFSARHHRLNAQRRRLASWFDLGTKSGWSTAISTAHGGSARRRQRRAQLRAEAGACPLTRPAKPHPEGRQRVCGKAQCRLSDSYSHTTPAVGGSS